MDEAVSKFILALELYLDARDELARPSVQDDRRLLRAKQEMDYARRELGIRLAALMNVRPSS
jgi:hypothetical protein